LVRLQTGIDYLRQERQSQRRQLFEKLVQYWEEVKRIGLWKDLVETVRQRDKVRESPKSATAAPVARNPERLPAVARQQPSGDGGRSEPRSVSPRPAPTVAAERSLKETS
jgi:hypothetical protein